MKDLNSQCLRVESNQLLILDQEKLPGQELWINCETPDQMVKIIQALKIRGAPAIGVAAAVSLALYVEKGASSEDALAAAQALRAARPTAINLMAAIDRMIPDPKSKIPSAEHLTCLAEEIFEEDVQLCENMAENALPLIEQGDNILTHCNTGGLATVGIGTALGVIRKAHENGLNIHVFVDETRPLLQGARLTTWELQKLDIPYTLICDNAAASLMQRGKIQKVFLGADRVAVNGDFANKVGTYSVAVSAHYHQVPFYPVAPHTTLDQNCPSGKDIPIEEREAKEITGADGSFGTVCWSPEQAQTYNPAFDVTPVELVTGLVMDTAYYSSEELRRGCLKNLTVKKG